MKAVFRKKEFRIPFTKDGYEKVLAEKVKLLSQRPEALDNIRKAREMGDLSENGYYKASRARLSFLDAQLRRVERLVRLGRVVAKVNTGFVDIGSVVTITSEKQTVTYTIVGGYESNPVEKTISHISPIGRALMGKKIQDIVEVTAPAGVTKYTIVEVA